MKTDEEIIKALGICVDKVTKLIHRDTCKDCPYHPDLLCMFSVKSDALNLIRKQQAEIERLKCETGKLLPKNCPYAMQMEVSNKLETKIRAEAIKEFWDRLKAQNTMDERIISVKSGDDLVKEMAGENKCLLQD